jgi:urease accessory protein UreF
MVAQTILHRLAPALACVAIDALTVPVDAMHSTSPELDIAMLSHRRAHTRLFAT